ncbi:dispersed gene family protein 1 (DGF-1), partial [Trypanosoma theileri]
VLVLDGVQLLSTQFVVTRTKMTCSGGTTCAPILVEHGLYVKQSSAFYMDNCAVNSPAYGINFVSSDLGVLGGSVFSVQNSSWKVATDNVGAGGIQSDSVVVNGGSVMQFVSSEFRAGLKVLSFLTLELS